MKSFNVKIKGDILKWARQSLNMSVEETAHQLKIGPDIVSAFEKETEQPTIFQLQKMASFYKRSLAVFLLPSAPDEPKAPKDFRTIPDSVKKLSPKVKLAIRRAQRIQSLAFELKGHYDHKETFGQRISVTDDAETVAAKFRDKINLEVKQQIKWKDSSEAFNSWRTILENLNVFVLQDSMPLKEVRGFSLRDSDPYIIVINSKDTPNGKNFTLFHEYCHLLLNQSGLCDLREANGSTDSEQRVETFCNRFAGAFLVPKESLIGNEFVKNKFQEKWDDSVLEFLADEYKVSQEVILRRLVILRLASEDFYKQKREEWSKIERKKYGRSTPAKKTVNQNGVAFSTLVINSFNDGKITFRDISDYLNVKPKYIGTIERILGY